MSIKVAEGVVEVTADATDVPGKIVSDIDGNQSSMGKAGERAGGSIFGGIMKSAIVLKGLDIVGDFLGGAIRGASDLGETSSKAATIFGGNIGQINTWAASAAENMGLSKAAALEAAAGFGNMFSQIGFTADEAARLSQNTVQMSADLGSFNNLPTADVSDRISAALRGEYDSLQALIPNINAARVEQEAMAMSGKSNASELTAQEKAAAVLAIVQKDGAAAMGDFAKTADGAANTEKTLTASMEDQQAKLGNTLMPIWQGFLGFLTDTAIPVFTQIVDWIAQNAEWLGPLALGLGVATAAFWLLNVAMNANPIMLIITAIGLLVGAILWVATQTTFFQDTWRIAGDVIGNVMSFIGTVFTWLYENVIAPIVGFVVGYIQMWIAVFTQVGVTIWNVMQGIGQAFGWVWGNIISPVVSWITSAFQAVGDTVNNIFGGIGDFIAGVFWGIVDAIKSPINSVIGFLNQAIDGANAVGGAFGVNIGHIPFLAKGGRITSGGFAVVGEAGPEIINLPTGASVTPLDRARDEGGGDMYVEIYEAKDPLGSAGRIAKEFRKFRRG